MADRRFDDAEVGQILQRATEIQSGVSPSGSQQGLTLSELQKLASEVGIGSEVIERAAREVESGLGPKRGRNPGSVVMEGNIVGELSDEVWTELVSEARQFVGVPGKNEVVGNTREWVGGDVESVMLAAISREGRTKLKLLCDSRSASGIAWVLGGTLAFFLVTVAAAVISKKNPGINPFVTFAVATLIGTLVLGLTQMVARSYQTGFKRRVEALFARVSALAEGDGESVQSGRVVESVVVDVHGVESLEIRG